MSVVLFIMMLGGVRTFLQFRATPPHDMIKVEGERRLHSVCAGPETAPFVLFDAGAYGNYTHGWSVLEALKEDHRICLYDRAGMGWSDAVPAGESPDPEWHVEDMRRLTAALGNDEPYILIGHSMAGFRLHAYANAYPDELRGLIFVDAVRPQSIDMALADRFEKWINRVMTTSIILSRIGITGGVAYFRTGDWEHSGQRLKDNRRSISSVRHQKATKAEMTAVFEYYPQSNIRSETKAEQIPVYVFANNDNGRSNAPVAMAALKNTGLGGVTFMPEASHVSLLNDANSKLIARAVRKITRQTVKAPVQDDMANEEETLIEIDETSEAAD